MKKHIFFVFAFLLGLTGPASLEAAVEEEYKSVEQIDAEQASAPVEVAPTSTVAKSESVQVVEQTIAPAPVPAVAYSSAKGDVVLQSELEPIESSGDALKLTPMVGASVWHGMWGVGIRTQYSFGLALEFPVNRYFAFEAEGAYANFKIHYAPSNLAPNVLYSFNQYTLGGNSKVYLMSTRLRPYVGAGLAAVFYEMSRGVGPQRSPYNPIVGYANLMAGLEYELTESISVGGRAAWMIPVLNKPVAAHNGQTANPGFEEASVLNTNYYRILGTVSIKL